MLHNNMHFRASHPPLDCKHTQKMVLTGWRDGFNGTEGFSGPGPCGRAVGAVAYVLLSGHEPFYAKTEDDVLQRVCAGDFQFAPQRVWESVARAGDGAGPWGLCRCRRDRRPKPTIPI